MPRTMRPRDASRLRVPIAAAFSLVAVLLFAATAAGSLTERGFGLTTAPLACTLVVMSTAQGQQALHPGDKIDTRALDVHKRLHLMVTGSADGMEVPVMSNGARRMVAIAPMAPKAPTAAVYFRIAALFVFLAMGLFALWRGRDGASLGLGVFFAATPSLFFHHAYPGLPDPAIVAVLFLSAVLAALAYLGLYGMIESLAADSPARRYFTVTRAVVVAALGLVAITSVASLSTQLFSGCEPVSALRIVFACYALVLAAGFAVLWSGMHGASPAHRRRLSWIFWSTVAGYAGPLATYALIAAQRPVPFDGLYNIAFLAIPLGYSYAVLRHRVIDVGFVLNRALAYTLLTTVVVGAFTLTESFASHLALGNTESMLLQIAVPLAVGLSFNALHKRVEHALESVFFRERHRAEAALAAFATQTDRFANRHELAQHAVEEIVRWGGAGGCALYKRTEHGFERAARAGEGDFAAAMERVDIDALERELGPGCAYPLSSSGRLEGVLLLRPRGSGEAFTPDEIALFETVARQVAAALTGLRLAQYERFIESLTFSEIAEPIRSRAAAIVAEP